MNITTDNLFSYSQFCYNVTTGVCSGLLTVANAVIQTPWQTYAHSSNSPVELFSTLFHKYSWHMYMLYMHTHYYQWHKVTFIKWHLRRVVLWCNMSKPYLLEDWFQLSWVPALRRLHLQQCTLKYNYKTVVQFRFVHVQIKLQALCGSKHEAKQAGCSG